MSIKVLLHQRDKAVQLVNENHSEVYEDKPEMLEAIESFKGNNLRTAIVLAILAPPRLIIFLLKKDQAKRLKKSLSRKAGVGILLATQQKDEAKLAMYKLYKKAASQGNAWELYQASMKVAEELAKEDVLLTNAGVSVAELAAFKSLAIEFGVTVETTDAEVKLRKSARQERDTLLSENAAILRYQLDPFANQVQDLFPDFFRDHKIARRSPLPHKATAKPVEVLTELSGTVTNSVTGEPVEGAVVMAAELNLVTTTDEDGYYMFEEVPVGEVTFSCHFAGFKLPADVPVTVTGTEPLQLDFNLEPETVVPVV